MKPIQTALFLAKRFILRANISTTLLVIVVMALTFLNLVFVSGILVGLIEGSSRDYTRYYSGDVLVSNLPDKTFIERSSVIISALSDHPEVISFSPRYIESATIEANYLQLTKRNRLRDTVGAELVGVDLAREELVTNLSQFVTVGEYLAPGDEGVVVIGAELLEEYSPISFAGFETIAGIEPGSKLRVNIGDRTKEVTVKGILESKSGPVERRLYFPERELRQFIGRTDFNVDEIAVLASNSPEALRDSLLARGFGDFALIRTSGEAQGVFFNEIKGTFSILGNVIGTIGLIVAGITVFIVIFINAITRRRYIGILKAIGITRFTIEWTYVFIAIFYALAGTVLGLLVLYGILVPYFDQNPIDFPFSDGILAITTEGVVVRAILLMVATFIAGYLPARIIAGGNTLNAILGR